VIAAAVRRKVIWLLSSGGTPITHFTTRMGYGIWDMGYRIKVFDVWLRNFATRAMEPVRSLMVNFDGMTGLSDALLCPNRRVPTRSKDKRNAR